MNDIRVKYKVYFLKPDKKDWVSRAVGLGTKLLGSDQDYTHVVITQEGDEGVYRSFIELTTNGLDTVFFFQYEDDVANDLESEIKEEIKERFTACVTLSVTLDHHVEYLRSLETLRRSNCRSHLWDFLSFFFNNRCINQPVCTYPVLELMRMKHNTLVLPKNLFEYFRSAVETGHYVLDHDIEIVSLQVASYDNDPEW